MWLMNRRRPGAHLKSTRTGRTLRRSSMLRLETLEDRAVPASTQNFDGVAAPALPAGWSVDTAITTTNLQPWKTVAGANSFSAPNHAFVNDPDDISDTRLVTPTLTYTAAERQLTFQNRYNLENTYDGGVLEININNGGFQDIIAAGGSFGTGGYNGVIATGHSNPLGGRNAWTGNNGAYTLTTVNLPMAGDNLPVVLRWRLGTDDSASGQGWFIDDIIAQGNGLAGSSGVNSVTARWGAGAGLTSALNNFPDATRMLPTGRNNTIPWNINKVDFTLASAPPQAPTVTVVGSFGALPFTMTGGGTSYTITLNSAITTGNRVTVTVSGSGIATFQRRMDILPGDVTDDGKVLGNDFTIIGNNSTKYPGTYSYNQLYDINGDGVVDANQSTATNDLAAAKASSPILP